MIIEKLAKDFVKTMSRPRASQREALLEKKEEGVEMSWCERHKSSRETRIIDERLARMSKVRLRQRD